MTISDTERRVRSALPVTRFLTAYMPLSMARWFIAQSVDRAKLPAGIARKAVLADGVSCEWISPDNAVPDQVLLYLHGGGFIYGASSMHMEMVSYLAQKMGMRALMVDYRLAPDHPFPVPLEDCVTAYRWLLKQGFSSENIVVAGDSAGGNLTITSLMKLRDDGDPLPAAAACFSPVADLSNKEADFNKMYDAVLHPRAARFMNESYLADADAHHPLISPVYGHWEHLPPLIVHAGGEEILRTDASRIEELIREASGEVEVTIYPRMWHVWQLHLSMPEAVESLDTIAQFLKSKIERVHSVSA